MLGCGLDGARGRRRQGQHLAGRRRRARTAADTQPAGRASTRGFLSRGGGGGGDTRGGPVWDVPGFNMQGRGGGGGAGFPGGEASPPASRRCSFQAPGRTIRVLFPASGKASGGLSSAEAAPGPTCWHLSEQHFGSLRMAPGLGAAESPETRGRNPETSPVPMPTVPLDARALGDQSGLLGQSQTKSHPTLSREEEGDGAPPPPPLRARWPSPRASQAAPRRAGRGRRGGRVSREPAASRRAGGSARRAFSAAPSPGSPPPGGHSAPRQLEAPGPAERALSAPVPSAAAAAGGAPSTPRFPRAGGASSLPTCPRLGGAGHSPVPGARTHTPRRRPPPPSPPLPTPVLPPRRRAQPSAQRPLPQPHFGAARQPAQLPAAASQLFPTPPPAAAATAAPSEPAATPNPRNKPRTKNSPFPTPPHTHTPLLRSPSHTRD